jgi:O-antigen biosynthesis protein
MNKKNYFCHDVNEMKKISIIIVNYNVEFFLEQCLTSVYEALEGISAEILVVDNNSVDHSVDMVSQKFPGVILIQNNENHGFSKANNQAIHIAHGEYILLLNPDTLLQKDTLRKSIEFMDSHPDAGGLGVQMIDGKGNFLPESKRGLPTPWVAFYKIFGLSRLFPQSEKFGKYHLSYLDPSKNHEVEVLSGAFMMLRASVIEEIGGLDETFFMYGEDIDLSYRITQAGYKNYYFADTKIIHYKGESTKKGSLNYVLTFYNAMKIFAEKHYSKSKLKAFIILIKFAIFLRATLAIFHRFFARISLPFFDFVVLASGFYILIDLWQRFVIFPEGGHYPWTLIVIAIPVYTLIWMLTSFLSGIYDKPVKSENVFKGVVYGTVSILLIYSLLGENMRFSRALIFLGSGWALLTFFLIRLLFGYLDIGNRRYLKRKYLIVGDDHEPDRVKDILLNSSPMPPAFIGFVATGDTKPKDERYSGVLNQLEDIIRIYGINEVIFCSRNITAAEIINTMSSLQHIGVDMKIAPADSIFIIGSNSINASGDVFLMSINNISKQENRRKKRVFDIFVSITVLIFYFIIGWFVHRPLHGLINVFRVMAGVRTWVGYTEIQHHKKLPYLKKGILNPTDQIKNVRNLDAETIQNLNIHYAKDYRIANDLRIILASLKHIGR